MTAETFRGALGEGLIRMGVLVVMGWLVGSATDSWRLGVAAGLALMQLTDWRGR